MNLETEFLLLWRKEAEKHVPGTKINYNAALKCFRKLSNGSPYSMNEWKQAMLKNGLSRTSVGIYLRAARVVWNATIKGGYLDQKDYPFGQRGISIPQGRFRKQQYLPPEKMRTLYDLLIKCELTKPRLILTDKEYYSLSLFLVLYLSNGMNLTDLAYLEYGDEWFQSGGHVLRFSRRKTIDRNEFGSDVLIPVSEPLKMIIDLLGSKPQKGKRVFESILYGATDENRERQLISQAGQNIRKRMLRVAERLGWTERPSATWARHSFATNLIRAGVPERYISRAMGHSLSSSITFRYIEDYSFEQAMSFNNKLLG